MKVLNKNDDKEQPWQSLAYQNKSDILVLLRTYLLLCLHWDQMPPTVGAIFCSTNFTRECELPVIGTHWCSLNKRSKRLGPKCLYNAEMCLSKQVYSIYNFDQLRDGHCPPWGLLGSSRATTLSGLLAAEYLIQVCSVNQEQAGRDRWNTLLRTTVASSSAFVTQLALVIIQNRAWLRTRSLAKQSLEAGFWLWRTLHTVDGVPQQKKEDVQKNMLEQLND